MKILSGFTKIIALGLILTIVLAAGVKAQNKEIEKPENFPRRTIKWVVPYGSGGGSDSFARQLSKQAEELIDVPIRVVNQPGGGGLAALPSVMSAPADGYTLYGAGPYINIGELLGNTQFSHDALQVIAQGQKVVSMIFARPNDKRFQNWEDLVEYMTGDKKDVSLATAGLGGIEEIVVSSVERQAGVRFSIVPFSQPGERYSAMVGGQVDLLYEQPGDVKSLIEANKIEPLLVLRDTEERLGGFEEVPSSLEHDISIPISRWRGVAVKDGVPEERIRYLEKVFERAWKTEEYQSFQRRKFLHYIKGWKGHEEMEQYMDEEYELFKEKLSELGYDVKISGK